MKTLDLPEGNAFGADESDSATPYVEDVEQRAQTLFFVWVTLTEHKWVIFGERRGSGCFREFGPESKGESGPQVGNDGDPMRRVATEAPRRAFEETNQEGLSGLNAVNAVNIFGGIFLSC